MTSEVGQKIMKRAPGNFDEEDAAEIDNNLNV